jgi:hypothetical protein
MSETPVEYKVQEEPGTTLPKWQMLLGSRKFWAALIGLALVIIKAFRPDFPIQEEQLTNLIYVLVAYILGVALEDGLTAKNTHAGA